MKHVRLLGIRFTSADFDQVVSFFDDCIARGTPHQVCVANVHTVMVCREDPSLKGIYDKAAAVLMDGLPLVWLARKMGHGDARRIAGPDLLQKVCSVSVEKGYRHFLYGGGEGVADSMKSMLEKRYEGIQIVGSLSPPFRPLRHQEQRALTSLLKDVHPHFLWVGLGAPRQEKWIFQHMASLQVPVQVGIGAAFDFASGRIRRAPEWVQRAGLEWLYRLTQDPARLWKRYLFYNLRFMRSAAAELLRAHPGQSGPSRA